MLKRIILLIVCVLLLAVSWNVVLGMQSPLQEQMELIALADAQIEQGTYINAEPHLVRAITYNTNLTFGAMEKLKQVYAALDYTQEYIKVLKKQTDRMDCTAEAYDEFARYYLEQEKIVDALKILKLGIERTSDAALIALYEKWRYAFTVGTYVYEDVTAFHNGGIQVKTDNLWGLADGSGKLVIPCEYEQVTTFDTASNGCVIALQADGKAIALNMMNQKIAGFDTPVKQLGNLSQDIVPLQLINDKWIIANSKLISNNKEFDGIGIADNSAIAVKESDKWGIVSLDSKVIAPSEYDEIITDELGRCYAQNAAFVKRGGRAYLFVNETMQSEAYDDAQPFTNDGWAAVMKNGKWGFIDNSGELKINYQYEDALSFSQNLAAVKISSEADGTEYWGFINLDGKLVIEPIFLKAKNFANGKAPVLTELGWQFISLYEHGEGAGL